VKSKHCAYEALASRAQQVDVCGTFIPIQDTVSGTLYAWRHCGTSPTSPRYHISHLTSSTQGTTSYISHQVPRVPHLTSHIKTQGTASHSSHQVPRTPRLTHCTYGCTGVTDRLVGPATPVPLYEAHLSNRSRARKCGRVSGNIVLAYNGSSRDCDADRRLNAMPFSHHNDGRYSD